MGGIFRAKGNVFWEKMEGKELRKIVISNNRNVRGGGPLLRIYPFNPQYVSMLKITRQMALSSLARAFTSPPFHSRSHFHRYYSYTQSKQTTR